MLVRAVPSIIVSAIAALVFGMQAQAQPQFNRCLVDGRTVFQETPCPKPRFPDPVATSASARIRPDPEALRAEQARKREELQKGFREVREVPRTTPDQSSRAVSSSPQSTSKAMGFDDCIRTIQTTSGQLGVAPRNIVETNDMRIVRFITNDGSVLVTCSRADGKMVTTMSAN
jgi:hypothetical protein